MCHISCHGPRLTRQRGITVQSDGRREVVEARRSRAAELGKQGAWVRWELNTTLHGRIYGRFPFLFWSLYDSLPSPANIHQWELTEDPAWKLYGDRNTITHILSECIYKVDTDEDMMKQKGNWQVLWRRRALRRETTKTLHQWGYKVRKQERMENSCTWQTGNWGEFKQKTCFSEIV